LATQSNNFITGDAAFAVDQDGIIVLWNKEAENLLGYSASEALGQRCWRLLAGNDIYNNRYCCENCPLREMVSRHESVHGFPLRLKSAREGQKQVPLSFLEIFGHSGKRLLLHICHSSEEVYDVQNQYRDHTNHHEDAQRPVLTRRELEVLELLSEGKATRQIAEILCISPATVRNHVQHTMHKLRVHSRLETVIKCQQLNLV
jgi:DNA-binding NarL/FixJ family response regulator